MEPTKRIKRISKPQLTALLTGLALTISAFTAVYAAYAARPARAPKTAGSQVLTFTLSATPAFLDATPLIMATPSSTTATFTATSTLTYSQSATSASSSNPISTLTTVPTTSSTLATTATSTPSPATTSPSTKALPGKVIIKGFPSLQQSYSLSCEYAAASAVTLYWGNQVYENVFVSQVPASLNPHLGFRGNINGSFGGVNDYGVYAEALVPVLEAKGYDATVFYGGVSRLKANIAAGNPVVVWITAGKYTKRTPVVRSYKGQSFTLVAGEHAVVIYGYDSGGVYIMDVASGSYAYTAWDSFVTRWSYFDQMALVITPK